MITVYNVEYAVSSFLFNESRMVTLFFANAEGFVKDVSLLVTLPFFSDPTILRVSP